MRTWEVNETAEKVEQSHLKILLMNRPLLPPWRARRESTFTWARRKTHIMPTFNNVRSPGYTLVVLLSIWVFCSKFTYANCTLASVECRQRYLARVAIRVKYFLPNFACFFRQLVRILYVAVVSLVTVSCWYLRRFHLTNFAELFWLSRD